MTTIWIIPLVITTLGMLLIAGFARRAADEAAAFRRSVERFGELRLALVEIHTASAVLRDHLRRR